MFETLSARDSAQKESKQNAVIFAGVCIDHSVISDGPSCQEAFFGPNCGISEHESDAELSLTGAAEVIGAGRKSRD